MIEVKNKGMKKTLVSVAFRIERFDKKTRLGSVKLVTIIDVCISVNAVNSEEGANKDDETSGTIVCIYIYVKHSHD